VPIKKKKKKKKKKILKITYFSLFLGSGGGPENLVGAPQYMKEDVERVNGCGTECHLFLARRIIFQATPNSVERH